MTLRARLLSFTFSFTVLAALAPLRAALAASDSAATEPPVAVETARTALPRPYQISVSAALLPAGRIMSGASGESSSYPSATAFGIVPAIDRRISRHLTLGLALPVQFNVGRERSGVEQASTEIDALVRLTAWLPVADRVRLFGFAAPGYYVMLVPSDQRPYNGTPQGLVAAVGGGVTYALSDRWFLSGDVGAQAGLWPQAEGNGLSYPQGSAYLRVGMGAGVAF